ncbi:MAG: type III secretion chaperone SycN [Endozoicomonas sp.]|uniref:type III secretion chaperone SycN n=1 Tax=Endozoicomonas sp. TaxID=1892382 RepID=UPI003D9B1339
MDWRDEVISDIGRGMGIEGLNFGASGVISIEFESERTLYLETQEDGVLIYLVQGLSRFDAVKSLVHALRQCHYTKSLLLPLQAGLKGEEELVWLIYLQNEQFTQPTIESSIETLIRQSEQLAAA